MKKFKDFDTVAALILSIVDFFIAPKVFAALWQWFVAPLGTPSLNYIQAMGILLIISFVKASGALALMESTFLQTVENYNTKIAARNVFYTVSFWGIGFLIYSNI